MRRARRTGRRVARALAGALLAAGALACDPPSHPLRVGTNLWPGYEPLYLARDDGLLEPQSVRLVELLSATQVLGALRAGALEAAAVTLDEALQIADDGPSVDIIAVFDDSRGADALVARADITDLAGLRGRRVAVEDTALGAWMLSRALESVGLTPKDVEVVSVEVGHHVEAYANGAADAVVTFDPARQQLVDLGARVLFDSSMIPGEVMDVLVARHDVLATPRRREVLKKLLLAWDQEVARVQADPLAAAARMPRLKSDPATIAGSLSRMKLYSLADSRALITGPEPPLAHTVARLATLAEQRKLIEHHVDVSHAIDASLLPPERR